MKTKGSFTEAKAVSDRGRQGMVLGVVMVIVLALAILGVAMLSASTMNSLETSRYLNSVKAFWLADAGVQRFENRAYSQSWSSFSDTALGGGTIQVTVYSNATTPYAECVGTVQGARQRVQVEYSYLAPSFNYAAFAGNRSSNNWYFTLRGNGNPTLNAGGSGHDRGGHDAVMGDVYVNGNVSLYEQSIVSNAPAPNTYQMRGDIAATKNIALSNAAPHITGTSYPNQTNQPAPDVTLMNYSSNPNVAGVTWWDVAKEFQNAGVTSGNLPVGHPLRNVVVKNPSDRSAQNNSTAGQDDYFFEPMNANNNGANQYQANTPLNLGQKTIYYVDGNVWVDNLSSYGFAVTGTATIAATRDIHISDNLRYATTNDLLGLIAVGTYDISGNLVDGGNIYFGDPTYGTLYTADAFMFAANNFYYNTSADNPSLQQEPTTGFQVYGNYAAMNQVLVYRDWYDTITSITTNGSGSNKTITTNTVAVAAWFDPSTNRWRDVVDSSVLTSAETNTLRHYQMTLKYDERIHRASTQPPRLPGSQSGVSGVYFNGITKWKFVPFPN